MICKMYLEKIEKVFHCILMEKICELLNIIKVGFIQTKQIELVIFKNRQNSFFPTAFKSHRLVESILPATQQIYLPLCCLPLLQE